MVAPSRLPNRLPMKGKVRSAVIKVILNGYQNRFLKLGCAWMHWHGVHLTPAPGLPSPRLVRMDVEHAFLIDRFILIVEVDYKDTQPEECGEDRHEVGDSKGVPRHAACHVVLGRHAVRVEEVKAVSQRKHDLEDGQGRSIRQPNSKIWSVRIRASAKRGQSRRR